MMLKKNIIRKLIVSSMALFILLIYYLFPNNNRDIYKQTLTYNETEKESVYVLNNENLVSRINVNIKKTTNDLDKIKEIIEFLKNNDNSLPSNFFKLIPKDTKILSLSLEDKLLKIDFNEEFLNVSRENERKLIETVVYSLSELENVDKIMIFIEGEKLDILPQSGEKLPNILNKDLGVNLNYNFNSLKDTSKTTVYYGAKSNDYTYYIPVTFIENNNDEKIEIIIEKLKNSPIYESNLISFLNANTKLTNYEILEEEIKLSFNKYLLDNIKNDDLIEEVKYTLYLSIRDNYNVKKIEFSIDDNDNFTNLVLNALE